MIEWFRQLAPRERLVLAAGSVAAVVIVGWTLVWSPLRAGASELDATVAERTRQLVDLRRAATLRASSSAAAVAADSTSPVVVVEETARRFELSSAIYATRPDGNDAINVSFRDARFDRLISWLGDIEQSHGLGAVQASFTRSSGPGLVTGQVKLER